MFDVSRSEIPIPAGRVFLGGTVALAWLAAMAAMVVEQPKPAAPAAKTPVPALTVSHKP